MQHVHQHLNPILNQFSPLKRKSLVMWLKESKAGRKTFHRAFLSCLEEVISLQHLETLDRRTKIVFTLLCEFGSRLSPKTIHNTLADLVENRMRRKSVTRLR